jgi:C_GCAxxG_C_C family probable redox protein
MLGKMMQQGFGIKEDLNCAETILSGANQAYCMGLDAQDLKLAAGFGGGMAIEGVCGTLTAAIMALGPLFVRERAHESTRIKELTAELIKAFEDELGAIDCASLKARYRTEERKCRDIIEKAAEILDRIVQRELQKERAQVKAQTGREKLERD